MSYFLDFSSIYKIQSEKSFDAESMHTTQNMSLIAIQEGACPQR